MDKITFLEFERVMSCDLRKKKEPCIEICFDVEDSVNYRDSWMGKMIDKDTGGNVYWFGLVPDGSQAYDFALFDEFVNAEVFYGRKSLKEIWPSISVLSLDGGTVSETLSYFLKLSE